MIPKIIHYCWFGGKEKSNTVKNCIESWKRFMPDYEIKEWNESNYDINKFEYSKTAYKEKVWGFVADPIRADLLYEYGGIYFDTDIEAYKSFDDLLDNKMFMGFEQPTYLSTATIGAEKGHPYLKEIIDEYHKRKFERKDVWTDYITSPMIFTDVLSHKAYCKHFFLGSWT